MATMRAGRGSSPYLRKDQQAALVHRLARVAGHLQAIRRMVEERRCVDEILLQVAAVQGGLRAFATQLVEQELNECVASCMDGSLEQRLQRLAGAVTRLFA